MTDIIDIYEIDFFKNFLSDIEKYKEEIPINIKERKGIFESSWMEIKDACFDIKNNYPEMEQLEKKARGMIEKYKNTHFFVDCQVGYRPPHIMGNTIYYKLLFIPKNDS